MDKPRVPKELFPPKPLYKRNDEGSFRVIRFTGIKPWPLGIMMKDSKTTCRGFQVVNFCLPDSKGGYLMLNIGEYITLDETGIVRVVSEKLFNSIYREFYSEEY